MPLPSARRSFEFTLTIQAMVRVTVRLMQRHFLVGRALGADRGEFLLREGNATLQYGPDDMLPDDERHIAQRVVAAGAAPGYLYQCRATFSYGYADATSCAVRFAVTLASPALARAKRDHGATSIHATKATRSLGEALPHAAFKTCKFADLLTRPCRRSISLIAAWMVNRPAGGCPGGC